MNKLEERLEEAYNDLEEVDKQFDELTQENKKKIDYCINKRLSICNRIKTIKEELKLDEEFAKNKMEESAKNNNFDWNTYILSFFKQ